MASARPIAPSGSGLAYRLTAVPPQVQYEFLKGAMHTSRMDGEGGGMQPLC
jgi:hypothetical protein